MLFSAAPKEWNMNGWWLVAPTNVAINMMVGVFFPSATITEYQDQGGNQIQVSHFLIVKLAYKRNCSTST